MDNNMVVTTWRYMWRLKGSDKVCFKIVTDTDLGHSSFISELKKVAGDDLETFAREYVCEYSVAKIGLFEKIVNNLEANNEKVCN